MKYQVKVLNTRSRDLRTSLLFTVNETNFIFALPDGCQRVAIKQMKHRYVKMDNIVIPAIKPDYMAGMIDFLAGCVATQHDLEVQKKFRIFGPVGLKDVMKMALPFSGDIWSGLEMYEFPENLFEAPAPFEKPEKQLTWYDVNNTTTAEEE